jgi:hypothetical protein
MEEIVMTVAGQGNQPLRGGVNTGGTSYRALDKFGVSYTQSLATYQINLRNALIKTGLSSESAATSVRTVISFAQGPQEEDLIMPGIEMTNPEIMAVTLRLLTGFQRTGNINFTNARDLLRRVFNNYNSLSSQQKDALLQDVLRYFLRIQEFRGDETTS